MSAPLRILQVVPTYLPATRYGGPIQSVHGLCQGLVDNGHDVHVFTTNVDGPDDSDVPLGRPIPRDGVQVWYFPSHAGRRLYYSRSMRQALRAELPSFQVMHLHSVFLWPTSAAARIAHAHHVPYVVSPRGMLVPELIAERSRHVKRAWLTLFESRTLAQAAAVHCTSRRELRDARKLPLPLPDPFVLPNGVRLPPDRFGGEISSTPRADALRARGRYALYLGRLSWKKNLELAIRSLVGNDIRLVLCGPDEEGLTPALTRLSASLGVADRVQIEAPVDGDDTWAVLTGAQLLILPSRNENFGNVVPEAMAVGRPVVVTHGVGASELVREADAGLVCAPELDSLRDALLQLWQDPARAAAYGARGAAYVRKHLTWAEVARSMAQRYRDLIARASAEPSAAQP